KEEVAGTLEAVQLLHGVAQLLPKSKESYHSKCQEYERLRKEGTSQKEIDKAELKWRKAGEALRRAVDKYNSARADFEQRMLDSAMRFQEVEAAHLQHMKGLISSYSHSVEDTHVQIGQVHEEFKQNVENIGTEMLLRRFAESKGTGRERPGEGCRVPTPTLQCPAPAGAGGREGGKEGRNQGVQEGSWEPLGLGLYPCWECWRIPPCPQGCPEVDEDGFTVRPDTSRSEGDPRGCSSSDSDYDEEEPRRFYVHIKPVQPRDGAASAEAAVEQLKATVGNLILNPALGVSLTGGGEGGRNCASCPLCPLCPLCPPQCSGPGKAPPDPSPPAALFGPPLESAFEAEDFPGEAPRAYVLTSSSSPFSSSSPENVEDSEASSPDPFGEPWVRAQSPSREQQPPPRASSNSASSSSSSPAPQSGGESSSPSPWACQGAGTSAAPAAQPEQAPREVPLVAPPRRSRSKRAAAGTAAGSNSDLVLLLHPLPVPPSSRCCVLGAEGGCCRGGPTHAVPPGLSRGPSPVVLGSQDALPVATAFTEYVHAYFKGHDTDSCLVKVTGELTMSFPAGIIRVFSGTLAPPVLSFRLLNAAAIEQFLPNTDLLYSDPSQSDPSTKDFWLNMAALTGHLQKQAEQCPAASYYNVALLKYQFSRLGPAWAPLRLCVRWDCSPGSTRVSVDYGYNAAALALPVPLANVHVLLPVDEPVANLRLQPAASWNLEEKRLLWRLLDVPGAPGQGGCGRLCASWEPLCGPSKPSPVAAQFSSEGSTLSGVEVELASAGYRMSLVKKRFATGTARGGC
ncbi:FCHO1 protein, partial [Tricholaema leucomelas]|nr:FCHO1 protein [Tricholaema leucomelas]